MDAHRRSLVLVIATVLAIGAGALAVGSHATVSPEVYPASDTYMAQYGFRVMLEDGTTQPAKFGPIERVYVTGSGPRVVLLHELPGLRHGDIELGAFLGRSFEVYMPLMFGVARQDNTGLGKRQACKSGLFKCNDRDTQHPIVKDLMTMTNRICDGRDCGVIGMCLTGTFPLYLAPAKNVVAMVLAQPTLPIVWHIWPFAGLDISQADTEAAMKIAVERKASIYMLRYRNDWISGRSAFNRLVRRIEPYKDRLSFFKSHEIDAGGHSTLVHDPKQPHVAQEQLEAVVNALNVRLRATP